MTRIQLQLIHYLYHIVLNLILSGVYLLIVQLSVTSYFAHMATDRIKTSRKRCPYFSVNRPQTWQSIGFSTILTVSIKNIIIYIFWHGNIKSYHMLMIHKGPILKQNLNHFIRNNEISCSKGCQSHTLYYKKQSSCM